ncbi:hypothetical protein BOFL111202_17735 [Bordetella flabilis]
MPPLEPATVAPPVGMSRSPAWMTCSVSPSGSLSRPAPCGLPVSTLPETVVSSVLVAVSFTATGPGLVTLQSKVSETEAPLASVAVTTTWYTPLLPPCEAEWSMLPLMTPVLGSITRPGGRPIAL